MENNICTITIVDYGMPDAKIRVTPADHKEEKIWLNREPGRDRWKAVKSLMTRFCAKGNFVPDPMPTHPTSGTMEDRAQSLIKSEEDIPLVVLDGAVLSAPPVVERVRLPQNDDLKIAKDQVATLTAQVGQLAGAVASIVEAMSEKKGPGRPRKED